MVADCFQLPDLRPDTFVGFDVDWYATGSTMILPFIMESVVGDSFDCLCREVLGINFLSFAMINSNFTAREVEEAWLTLPILRRGKERTRGASSGKARRQNHWGGHWCQDGWRT